jgi:hypothetical protein
MPPNSLSAAQTETFYKLRAVSRLAHSALHLVTHRTPSSLLLKSLIGQLGRFALGALADQELGEKMVRFLRFGDKNTTAATAKDWHHLGKACVYTAEDVVQLREEREQINQEKAAKIKNTRIRLQLKQHQ